MPSRRWDRLIPLTAVAAPVAVGGALVGLRSHIDNADGALILLAVVVIVATTGRRGSTAVSAVMGALSFDFFLTRPYYSLRITRSFDLVTEILLVVIGLAVGDIAARGRRARQSSRARADELQLVHHIAEHVARGDDVDTVIAAVSDELRRLLHLQRCVYTNAPERPGARIEPDGEVVVGQVVWGPALPTRRVELPVRSGGRRLGAFVLTPTPAAPVSHEGLVVAVSLADQLGAALAAREARRSVLDHPTRS